MKKLFIPALLLLTIQAKASMVESTMDFTQSTIAHSLSEAKKSEISSYIVNLDSKEKSDILDYIRTLARLRIDQKLDHSGQIFLSQHIEILDSYIKSQPKPKNSHHSTNSNLSESVATILVIADLSSTDEALVLIERKKAEKSAEAAALAQKAQEESDSATENRLRLGILKAQAEKLKEDANAAAIKAEEAKRLEEEEERAKSLSDSKANEQNSKNQAALKKAEENVLALQQAEDVKKTTHKKENQTSMCVIS